MTRQDGAGTGAAGAGALAGYLVGNSANPGGDAVSGMKTTSLAAFASQLRAWRQQVGWTQVEAAGKLGNSASLVSGIETKDKTPTAEFAARCDAIFGTPGTFATMRDVVAREIWPPYFAPVIDLETSAIWIHECEMRVVPGLLRTEEYARAVISAGKPRESRSMSSLPIRPLLVPERRGTGVSLPGHFRI